MEYQEPIVSRQTFVVTLVCLPLLIIALLVAPVYHSIDRLVELHRQSQCCGDLDAILTLSAALDAEERATRTFIDERFAAVTLNQRLGGLRSTWRATDAAVRATAVALDRGVVSTLQGEVSSVIGGLEGFRDKLLLDTTTHATAARFFTATHSHVTLAALHYLDGFLSEGTSAAMRAIFVGDLEVAMADIAAMAAGGAGAALSAADMRRLAPALDTRRVALAHSAEVGRDDAESDHLRELHGAVPPGALLSPRDVEETLLGSVSYAAPVPVTAGRTSAAAAVAALRALAKPSDGAVRLTLPVVFVVLYAVTVLLAVFAVLVVLANHFGSSLSEGRGKAVMREMSDSVMRVRNLMRRLSSLRLTGPTRSRGGKNSTATETELLQLVAPLKQVLAHLPQPLLDDADQCRAGILGALERGLTLRPKVTLAVIDHSFLCDAPITADTGKNLPQRMQRLRALVDQEAAKRGGKLLPSNLARWVVAWNLGGALNNAPQSAVGFAQAVLGVGLVEFPLLRAAVVTGTVAAGMSGTETHKEFVVLGPALGLARLASQVAGLHGSSLVLDQATHSMVAAHLFRVRPLEAVAADPESQPTVLYDMMSPLDHSDRRLVAWNDAFEKYRAGDAEEALALLRRWGKEQRDPSSERLERLLASHPPRLVTVGDAALAPL